jgi:hypothetical protein
MLFFLLGLTSKEILPTSGILLKILQESPTWHHFYQDMITGPKNIELFLQTDAEQDNSLK